jgi:SAM-dependent methyltransferase
MSKAGKLLAYTKQYGVAKTLQIVSYKIYPPKPKVPQLPNAHRYVTWFKGLAGIEIGGPSLFFQKSMRLYKAVKSLDCANFSTKTLWQRNLKEGKTYQYYKDRSGFQYICDTVDLHGIGPQKYDFCISCNVLEHIANPFKATSEWLRVMKKDGLLLLVIPRKQANFDHNRLTTTFEHLQEDYTNNVDEHDLSHLQEILVFHDRSMDSASGTYEQFKDRSLKNFENRALHQHVFDMDLLRQMFEFFNVDVLKSTTLETDYIIMGQKR